MTSPLMVQARIVSELRERLKAEHGLRSFCSGHCSFLKISWDILNVFS